MQTPHVSKQTVLQRLRTILIEQNIITHWSVLKRCTLILYCACLLNFVWIAWKTYLLATPSAWPYVHLDYMIKQLILEAVLVLIFLLCIFICQRFQHSALIKTIMPYICIALFTLNLCLEGYSVGIFSPATATGMVGVVGIGLLLFSRPLVYSALFVALIGMSIGTMMSLNGSLSYAPLFNSENLGTTYHNPFWIGSMCFFMVPLMGSFMVLFEILLAQWRYRESIIQRNSQIDPLTNLYNRRKINEHLTDLSTQSPMAAAGVILLDLDHFKRINDIEGHDMGDQVLVKVGQVLTQNVRSNDMVGRFGGEEFIILLSDADHPMLEQIAERCRQAIQNIQLYNDQGKRIVISASFGIRPIHQHEPIQTILKHADDALYAAKAAGRNCIKFYDQLQSTKTTILSPHSA